MKWRRPMKAKPVEASDLHLYEDGSWIGELKQNGHRMYLSRTQMWSSGGKVYGFDSKLGPGGGEGVLGGVCGGVVLDGELVARTGLSDHATVTHLRSHDPSQLVFVAFDLLEYDGESMLQYDWRARRMMLEQVVRQCDQTKVQLAEVFKPPFGPKLAQLLAQGHEGMILKHRDKKYTPGSRAWWLKLKGTATYDVVIVDAEAPCTPWTVRPGHVGTDGVLYPEGKRSETWEAGYVGLSYGWHDAKTGELVKVGALGVTGMPDDMAQHVGKVAECKSYGPPWKTGRLNHPVFLHWREDKSPQECRFDFVAGKPAEEG